MAQGKEKDPSTTAVEMCTLDSITKARDTEKECTILPMELRSTMVCEKKRIIIDKVLNACVQVPGFLI